MEGRIHKQRQMGEIGEDLHPAVDGHGLIVIVNMLKLRD